MSSQDKLICSAASFTSFILGLGMASFVGTRRPSHLVLLELKYVGHMITFFCWRILLLQSLFVSVIRSKICVYPIDPDKTEPFELYYAVWL